MKGRKPKPGGLAARDGDTRKLGVNKLKARIDAEPEAATGLPPCPAHLKGAARSAWKYWADELRSMDMDRRPDAMALEGACVAYETAIYAYDTIQQHGRMIVKREKVTRMVEHPVTHELYPSEEMVAVGVTVNPAVKIGADAWKQLLSFCSEFGFTPVSRTRLAVGGKSEDGAAVELAEILQMPRPMAV